MNGCTRHRMDRGLDHSFDPDSGWCLFGCGTRDDGRRANIAGAILRTGTGIPPTIPTTLDLDLEPTA